MLPSEGMYKSQYTTDEAQEQFRLIDESAHHQARKDRVKRYIQVRIVETAEVAEK
jgi:hypothetical protein